jgi:hypothetical protein
MNPEEFDAGPAPVVEVTLRRADLGRTNQQALWAAIRGSSEALAFRQYEDFINQVFRTDDPVRAVARRRAGSEPLGSLGRGLGVDAYRRLQAATEIFLMAECGIRIDDEELFDGIDADEESNRMGRPVDPAELKEMWQRLTSRTGTLPYLDRVRRQLNGVPVGDDPDGFLQQMLAARLTHPLMIELIWSYWHEEGMLVQALNAISMRFQNRAAGPNDPLAQVELDPLRPLNNLLWGYIQDEPFRLSVRRRAHEYNHHYGITLLGRAVPPIRAADSRSAFLEAFHNLLYICSGFFKEDDDTTVRADGFPVLNALREVHLLLTEGQHNQYGDLPWTARQEMLIQQWLLARPEMREFLPRRAMVDYPEAWMGAADAMKRLQGWTETSVLHFHDLAALGEQILLSIRFGTWNNVLERDDAANWARYWRSEIQGYQHAYRAVTGADVTVEPVDRATPALHLRRRLLEQQRSRRALSAGTERRALPYRIAD